MENEQSNLNLQGDVSDCVAKPAWAAIIFAIFAVIVLILIIITDQLDNNTKAWTFFVCLIAFLIWFAILWWFSRAGYHAVAWFLLLLPLAVAIFWWISWWLATATTDPHCVLGGNSTNGGFNFGG